MPALSGGQGPQANIVINNIKAIQNNQSDPADIRLDPHHTVLFARYGKRHQRRG